MSKNKKEKQFSENPNFRDMAIAFIKEGRANKDVVNALLKKKIIATEDEIALEHARIKAAEKFIHPEKMFFSEEDIRFSTPDVVANYRATRLSGEIIADLCCGIGSQAIAFAKHFKKVYAVDNNERKIALAKKNAEAFNIDNIDFICADLFDESVVSQIAGANCIFCDPERAPEEKERKIESIPFVSLILEKYSKVTKNICIELPPQISPEGIDAKKYDCEREYLSLNGKLNRLNIYFGAFKTAYSSAILIPANVRLFEHSLSAKRHFSLSKARKYIYEINPAVEKAGLSHLVFPENNVFLLSEGKRTVLFTSDFQIESPFARCYKLLSMCRNNENELIPLLKKIGAGSVVLRTGIEPKDYWNIRNSIEKNLSGKHEAHLFYANGNVFICQLL